MIRYLMRHHHTTPFEMCDIKLHVRVPMDCWRQWIRHRTASVNEYSTRYSEAIDSAQLTDERQWREQSRGNRQGSRGFLAQEVGSELSEKEAALIQSSRKLYQERLEAGVAREQARKDLPLSTYTEAYWKNRSPQLVAFPGPENGCPRPVGDPQLCHRHWRANSQPLVPHYLGSLPGLPLSFHRPLPPGAADYPRAGRQPPRGGQSTGRSVRVSQL